MIWTELCSRFIRAPAVHTIGLHAPSFIPRPKPRNQGNEGQPGCTHTERAHTRSATETQQPAKGELAAAAAAPPASPPLLLLLLLLLCCCCFTTRDASRSVTRRNRLLLVLCFVERTQERVTAQQHQHQQQQQQGQQQGRPKHIYEYTIRHQAG